MAGSVREGLGWVPLLVLLARAPRRARARWARGRHHHRHGEGERRRPLLDATVELLPQDQVTRRARTDARAGSRSSSPTGAGSNRMTARYLG